jgi:MFS family permease
VAVDASLLRRRRDFRLLVSAQVVSLLGSSLTLVAIPFQVYAETKSTALVGALGLAEFVPIVVLALIGGALADAFDRRRLMLATDVGSAAIVLVLALNATLGEPHVWLLFACASLLAALYALQRPAMDALFPRLVEPAELKTASALHWLLTDVAFATGPALGGLLLATVGAAATYYADAASFALSFGLLVLMAGRALTERTAPSLRGVKEGAAFAVSRQELLGSYLVDMNAMFFGVPQALFPALATAYGGPEVLGAMYAAPYAGSFVSSVTSGWTGRVHRHGRAVAIAAAAWGAAIIGFGFAGALWLALACLAVAGGADAISGIFRSTIWNEIVPDRLRGRLAGIELISYSSGPTLGQARAGATASLLGMREAVVAGGAVCVAGCFAVSALLPRFWSFKSTATVPNT